MKFSSLKVQQYVVRWMLIALFLGILQTVYSQSPAKQGDSLTFTQLADRNFAGIKKDSLSTRKLYDRVMPFANLLALENQGKDTVGSDRFYQGVSEIVRSSYDSTNLNFAFKVFGSIRKSTECPWSSSYYSKGKWNY